MNLAAVDRRRSRRRAHRAAASACAPLMPARSAAPPGDDLQDHDAVDACTARDLVGQDVDAEAGPRDLAVLEQLRNDRVDVSTGTAKPMPAFAPDRRVDRGVDADQAARAVEQRTAGVARD